MFKKEDIKLKEINKLLHSSNDSRTFKWLENFKILFIKYKKSNLKIIILSCNPNIGDLDIEFIDISKNFESNIKKSLANFLNKSPRELIYYIFRT